MTTIIIDLQTNQWLALIGAFGMGAVIACILTWPFVHMRGYEKRGYEKAEPHPDLEWMKTYRQQKGQ